MKDFKIKRNAFVVYRLLSSTVILIYRDSERQNFQLYSSAKLPRFVFVEFLDDNSM